MKVFINLDCSSSELATLIRELTVCSNFSEFVPELTKKVDMDLLRECLKGDSEE